MSGSEQQSGFKGRYGDRSSLEISRVNADDTGTTYRTAYLHFRSENCSPPSAELKCSKSSVSKEDDEFLVEAKMGTSANELNRTVSAANYLWIKISSYRSSLRPHYASIDELCVNGLKPFLSFDVEQRFKILRKRFAGAVPISLVMAPILQIRSQREYFAQTIG
jgi:hypothetical protein